MGFVLEWNDKAFIHSFMCIRRITHHYNEGELYRKLKEADVQMARKPERNHEAYKVSGFLRTKKTSLI